jgi:hypothetical protein
MGVDTLDKFIDDLSRNDLTFIYAHKEAIEAGKTEEEAEGFAMQAEEDEATEAIEKYTKAVMKVVNELYAEHDLELVETDRTCYPYKFQVVPKVSWRESAKKIIETINGVGMFEFRNVDEFLRSGPYTPRSGVMSHLHWVADHPMVYEGTKASRLIERLLYR